MAAQPKKKRRASTAQRKSSKSSAKKNPHGHHKKPARKKPSRNPDGVTRGRVGKATGLAFEFGTAALSLFFTRMIPQWVLGSKNTGWIGYGANLGTALILGAGARWIGGPRIGNAALIGGGSYSVSRFMTEKFSPIGQYMSLSGLGDATAATNLGTIGPGYWAHPAMHDAGGNPIIPQQIVDAARAGMMPAQPALSGYGQSAY